MISITSCGKAAAADGSGSPDTADAPDRVLAGSPGHSTGDNDPDPSAETDGGSGSDAEAGPVSTESASLPSTAEGSSLSDAAQDPDGSSSGDSTALSAKEEADSLKPADHDDGTVSGMDHSAVRRRPEHTADDLVYSAPAPQAPAAWTAPASQSANPSEAASKEKKEKEKKKEKNKKGSRIGSSMGGGGGY